MIEIKDIEKAGAELLSHLGGPRSGQVSRALAAEEAQPDSLVFASTPAQLKLALERGCRVLVLANKVGPANGFPDFMSVWSSPQIGLAMARILPLFDRKAERFKQVSSIHPTAVIDPSARLGRNVIVGPHVVVGPRAEIGDEVRLGANSVIETEARIGARTLLHPCVFVGAQCELGEDCEIHPHTTIGSDGFGFAQDSQFKHHKLPQLGRVVIGDRVEIGANCAIDRAAFSVTRIGSGTKFDNLCHVAHNCEIGEDSVIAGGFFVAGSSKIGKRFMVGGTAVVSDHVNICDGVILAGRATVTNDIEKPGAYGGYPLQPLKDSLKTISSLAHLTEMRKQIARVMKHLGLDKEAP